MRMWVRQDHAGPFQEGCVFPSWKGPEGAGLTEIAAAPSWKELIAKVHNKRQTHKNRPRCPPDSVIAGNNTKIHL